MRVVILREPKRTKDLADLVRTTAGRIPRIRSGGESPIRDTLPGRKSLHVHDLIVAGSVEIGDDGGLPIAAGLVEGAGWPVVGSPGRLHDDEPRRPDQPAFHFPHEGGPYPAALYRGIHRHPVEIVGTEGTWGRTPADPADEPIVDRGPQGDVIGRAADRAVED